MKRWVRTASLIAAAGMLSGCNLVLLNPSGDVAAQQGDLIVYATIMMMLIIGPVMALTVFFAWQYRASNDKARYEPEWAHSISLEIVIWAVPLAIIIVLAGLTWVATHRLDPYADLTRISETQAIDPGVEPMQVQVIALDWKWLFIYPDQDVATIGEMAVIKDRPVEFKLTSNTVMNAFYVPDMAGMIYAMAGMETELNAVMNATGTFDGFASQYNGNGFSHMDFDMHSFGTQAEFDAWVSSVRAKAETGLDAPGFEELAKPTVSHPNTYWDGISEDLWDRIINLCTGEGDLCQDDMMMVDALGGGGLEGLHNRTLFAGLCDADDPRALLALIKPELRADEDQLLAILMPPTQSEPVTQSRRN